MVWCGAGMVPAGSSVKRYQVADSRGAVADGGRGAGGGVQIAAIETDRIVSIRLVGVLGQTS